MKHAEEILGVALVTGNKATEVLQPGKEAFDFPAATATSEMSPVLSKAFVVVAVWSNHIDAALRQACIEAVGVVGSIADQVLRRSGNQQFGGSSLEERYFMRRSTLNACGDGKTVAVCNRHDLGTLGAFGRPNARPRF